MRGYPIINSPPDCTPPGTPRGKFKVPRYEPRGKISPTSSKDKHVSSKGSIKDIDIENFNQDVKDVCSIFVQKVLAGEFQSLQEDQNSEPKHQILDPEQQVKPIDGHNFQVAVGATLAKNSAFLCLLTVLQILHDYV